MSKRRAQSRDWPGSRIAGATTAVLLLAACAEAQQPGEGEVHDSQATHDAHADALTANATVRWVEVTLPSDRAFLEYPAQAVASPDSSALVSISHAGVVRTLSVSAGDRVEAGDVVAEVSVPKLATAAAAWSAGRTELNATEARHESLVTLEKKHLVGRTAVFDMEARALALRTELALAQAELASAPVERADLPRLRRDGVLVVRAPIAGVVTDVGAVVGGRAGGGEGVIATIRGEHARRVEANSARGLPPAGKARFIAVDGSSHDLSMPDGPGVTSPEDGRQRTWFELSSKVEDGPPAGLRGRVQLSELPEDLREIPLASLSVTDGAPSVLVESKDGRHERRAVEVVTTTESSALVRGPLQVGERVSSDPSRVLTAPSEGAAHAH